MRVVAPYARLAHGYDAALGRENFERTRRAFEYLVRRHGIRFRVAADLGSGTGLFARYLARCWRARVFAVDRSAEMLREAAAKSGGEDVTLLRQDLRRLRLPEPVDLVTANFDTINHLLSAADLACVLRRVARALCPGGHFIFDVITPAKPPGTFPRIVRIAPCRGGVIVQRIGWDRHQHLIRIQVIVAPFGEVPTVEEHLERAWMPEYVGRGLSEAGFAIRGIYDAATLRPASGEARRLLIVAQRMLVNREEPAVIVGQAGRRSTD